MSARLLETDLSEGLRELYDDLRPHRGTRLVLSPDNVSQLADRLQLFVKLARLLEAELTVHRLAEGSLDRRKVLEKQASAVLAVLVADPEGNVIRPDFGGKR